MRLSSKNSLTVLYHNIFDYPLTSSELVRWWARRSKKYDLRIMNYEFEDGYFFLKGRKRIIKERQFREKISESKFRLARKYAQYIGLTPFVKMVGVTGALAMKNARGDSDIDLMIVTKKGWLWTTRFITYFLLKVFRIPIRKPKEKKEKDRLCLNIWLDESDMAWPREDRNIFTAHEIAQIVPIINRGGTYERFLSQNKWILDYWPNSVRIKGKKGAVYRPLFTMPIIEKLAFSFQKWHMRSQITREVITQTRAIFHPVDRQKEVFLRLRLDK